MQGMFVLHIGVYISKSTMYGTMAYYIYLSIYLYATMAIYFYTSKVVL